MDTLFELKVTVAPRSSREVSSTLHRQLRSAILQGRIKAGAKLPPTRVAQSIFGVSRKTAQEVYERLADDGLAIARHGSGTYVADPLPVVEASKPAPLTQGPHPPLNEFWLGSDTSSALNFLYEIDEGTAPNRATIDLRPSLIDPKFFPFAVFRQVMARELRRLETRPGASRNTPCYQGNYVLRSAIADHVAVIRAVACTAEDVLVTSGAQQAWDLIARVLVRPGETVVALEEPGYPPMRIPFAAAGARIVPVRVDAEGLVVDEIPKSADIICVSPSHQFPLGMSMSASRRTQLINFARQNRAVVIEDDYSGEFRYDGSPLDALRSAASADVVFYIGTFSKCMVPSFRLGFIVPPPWAMKALVAAKNSLDWYNPLPLQLAVASFMKDGHLARHIRHIRRIYIERRDHLLTLFARHLNGYLEPVVPTYGMHFAAYAVRDIDCETVSQKLLELGIRCQSLNRYFLGPITRPGFVIGYASADVEQLSAGVTGLQELIVSQNSNSLGRRVA